LRFLIASCRETKPAAPMRSLCGWSDSFEPVWTCKHVPFDRALLSHSGRNGDRHVESETSFHRVDIGARPKHGRTRADLPRGPLTAQRGDRECSRCQICQSLSYGPMPPTHFARPASAPAGFSKARNRPTCRCWAPTLFKLGINRKTTDALGAASLCLRRRGDRVSAPGKAGAIQPVEVRPK